MAEEAGASYVIHTGDFGFYDQSSIDRMTEKTLRYVVQYSPLITSEMRQAGRSGSGQGPLSHLPSNPIQTLRNAIKKSSIPLISQYDAYKAGERKFNVPVYTVWGACEDIRIIEDLRVNPTIVPNLRVIDEHSSSLLSLGGLNIRLLGLGGALVMHKLFDNGEGRGTIAGGGGTMWCTALQMGELLETGMSCWDRSEVRFFVSNSSVGREGLLAQLALALRADFTISAGLHFRYSSSYNDFSVFPNLSHFRAKLAASKRAFEDVWMTVKSEVESLISTNMQKRLLRNILDVVGMMPSDSRMEDVSEPNNSAPERDELSFRNLWHFNVADASYGSIVFNIKDGQVSVQTNSQGFNFNYRHEESRRAGRPQVNLGQQQQQHRNSHSIKDDQRKKSSPKPGHRIESAIGGEERENGVKDSRSAATSGSAGPVEKLVDERTIFFRPPFPGQDGVEKAIPDLASTITATRTMKIGSGLVEFDSREHMLAALKVLQDTKPEWGMRESTSRLDRFSGHVDGREVNSTPSPRGRGGSLRGRGGVRGGSGRGGSSRGGGSFTPGSDRKSSSSHQHHRNRGGGSSGGASLVATGTATTTTASSTADTPPANTAGGNGEKVVPENKGVEKAAEKENETKD